MNNNLNVISDERSVSIEELYLKPHARILNLTELLPFLISPDSKKTLQIFEDNLHLSDVDGLFKYPIINKAPILYPEYISEHITNNGIELKYYDDPKQQYFLISQIKQRGETNAPSSNLHYQRHLFRMHEFVKTCEGTILDVGCDDVNVSSTIFSNRCKYIGLDPFSTSTSFRVVGVGEILPFKDSSINNVIFNTSLDHILDYYEAVKEAFRVLKPGGYIIICTLIWLQNTSILNDSVHFHHFKDYEINGVLKDFKFKIENTKRYTYKNDTHRYGLYISAKKT